MSTATNDRAPRSTAVAVKLAEAEALLSELEASVAPLALAELEGVAGAKRDLQSIESKIDAAKRSRQQLRSAHRHALELDRKADIADAEKMREEQFAVCQAAGARRLIAAQTIFTALATAATAMSEYAIQTNNMVTALPSGTNVGILSMGHNGWAGSWIGNLANLIAAEAYRLAISDKDGRGARLPFARAPDVRTDNPASIEPAMEILENTQAHAMREIELQLEKLNRDALAVISKPEMLKEAAA
jgi:hypothetical protein